MFHAKLRHIFEGNQRNLKDKPPDFFNMKINEIYISNETITILVKTNNEKSLQLST